MTFIQFFRLPNLFIVALTQWIIFYHLILPALSDAGIPPVMRTIDFVLLCITTLSVTASGYIINDLLNIENDRINRPERALPSGRISTQVASWIYALFSITGFIISMLLAFRLNKQNLLFLYPLSIGFLYAYSVYAQRKVLLGNLLIALFCAGVPLIIWAAELQALHKLSRAYPEENTALVTVIFWYSLFAFLSNLLREIVKDMEDIQGDIAVGMQTLPIRFGQETARKTAFGVGISLLLLIIFQFSTEKGSIYLLIGSGIPLLIILYLLQTAHSPRALRKVSLSIKILMISGIVALFLY